jgi:hypothetical protein
LNGPKELLPPAVGRGGTIAADRHGFAQIVLVDQHHQPRFARTHPRGAAVEVAGLPIIRQSFGAVDV